MMSTAVRQPKLEPVIDANVDDHLLKLRQDIALAQSNQAKFGHYIGNSNPEACASVVDTEGRGERIATLSTRSDRNEIEELAEAVRRLQEGHLRMTKRIYGLHAARIQAKSVGRNAGEVRFSAGELVVAVVRTVCNNLVSVELFISRNDKTSFASLEAYTLGQPDLVWRPNEIKFTGTPLDTMRTYVAQKESIIHEGVHVDSVSIDASLINGFRQSARCFCNEAFTIDYEAHGPVRCALHQIATSVIVRLREVVTPNAMLGHPLTLRDVPPEHHLIFKSGIAISSASLNQWPLRPPNLLKKNPKKSSKRSRAKKNDGSSDVIVQKKSKKFRRS